MEYPYRCKLYRTKLKRIGEDLFVDENDCLHLCGETQKGYRKGRNCRHLYKVV